MQWIRRESRRHDPARAGAIVAAILLAFALQAAAQPAASSYRQTVLAIQGRIEAHALEEARSLIGAALKKFPRNGGLENLLGIVEVQEGHTAAARQAFAAAVKHDPKLAGAYLNLGRLELQAGGDTAAGRARALSAYESALRLDPSNAEANYQAAILLTQSARYRQSLSHLARLDTATREQIGPLTLQCSDEAALGQKEAAIHSASLLASNPGFAEQDALTMLPALRAAHRADLLVTLFGALDQRAALSPTGLRILGLAEEADSKLDAARATLERAFAADPKSAEPLIDLARIAQELHDDKGALGYLAHARALEPDNADLSYQFGLVCLKMNLVEEARKAVAEAVRLSPDNPDYNLAMGMIVSMEHDPSEALPYLKKYHSLRPADSRGSLALGVVQFRSKDYDSALPWLTQAAADPQTAAQAHFYLGRIEREKGQPEQALKDLAESDRLKPQQADVIAEMGQIHLQQRQYPEAEQEFQKAMALDAENYAANFGLLQLYVRTSDPRRSQQSQRFEALKAKNEERSRDMMRMLQIVPTGAPKPSPQP